MKLRCGEITLSPTILSFEMTLATLLHTDSASPSDRLWMALYPRLPDNGVKPSCFYRAIKQLQNLGSVTIQSTSPIMADYVIDIVQ